MTRDDWEHIFNNQAAYEEFYTHYFKILYVYGKKLTAGTDLIEDSIQEVFLDLWAKKHKMMKINAVKSYLLSAFRYILLKKLKEAKKMVYGDIPEPEPVSSAEANRIAREQDDHMQYQLNNALLALTPHQREAVFLRFYQDLSYEEVASVLNISVKATYKIMARALAVLKAKMG